MATDMATTAMVMADKCDQQNHTCGYNPQLWHALRELRMEYGTDTVLACLGAHLINEIGGNRLRVSCGHKMVTVANTLWEDYKEVRARQARARQV